MGGSDADTMAGGSGHDWLQGGRHLFGGSGNDHLFGRDAVDLLIGGPGNDYLDGGPGAGDVVSYQFSRSPVHVALPLDPTAFEGDASGEGADELVDIEEVLGSDFDDELSGDDEHNSLRGGFGDDVLRALEGDDLVEGGSGHDAMDGGHGNDTATFVSSPTGIEASLSEGAATGQGSDALMAIENLVGSAYNDRLIGDDGPNELDGWTGDNRLFGRDGDDTLYFGGGDAGPGADTCFNSGALHCESHVVADPGPETPINEPSPGTVLEAVRFTRVSGTGHSGLGPPLPKRVFVALGRLTPHGCLWWNSSAQALVRQACARPLWNRVPLRYDETRYSGSWRLKVTPPLPAGTYDVYSALQRREQPSCWLGFWGPLCVEFYLR